MPSPTDAPAPLPERLADAEGELPTRLRIIADGDLRTMARDSLVGIHPDQHELHEWADLMDEAADALTTAADAYPASEPVTDLDHAQCDRDGWMESALRAQEAVAELQARLTAAESAREAAVGERDAARKSMNACIADMERGGTCKRVYSDAALGRELEDVEAARDAAFARAERAEKALEDLKGSFHEDSDAYAKISAALAHPATAEEI